ncbi:SDR family NAD(P)-dependent oxidoreductase [Microlunatus speluncae]|uniref:SDR family NAD(P)-dependent oxidoreductase n=1 Tax=Microlunatus speluncae TaxID=2594267 RepID=UPI001376164E|nr:SDR family oxidoreductase [Microlunatus speluncae]
MIMRFTDKVVVVSGGAAGIGRAVSELVAAEGASVVVADRDEALARETAAALPSLGAPRAVPVRVDVAVEEDIRALAEVCRAEFGRVDALINNAAARLWGPVTEATLESWHQIIAANLISVGLTGKHLIPLMPDGGSIVNVSSANGIVGRKGMAQYDATKAGVLGLTRSMACDHAEAGIRVNAVLPGPTLTDFHKNRAQAEGREIDLAVTRPHPGGPGILRRQGLPIEIAKPIVFLASDDASYMTGTLLSPDGGLSAVSGHIG